MANRKPQPRHLGTGMARQAGEAVQKRKKKTKRRMDKIMGEVWVNRNK